jgi:hypothetical protein
MLTSFERGTGWDIGKGASPRSVLSTRPVHAPPTLAKKRRRVAENTHDTDAGWWDNRVVNLYPADPLAVAVLVAVAAYLMTYAGVGKKTLRLRSTTCPVCHRPRTLCTCRWR